MPQCVVIADDLTGANATGVLLKKMNYKAYTVMNTERIELSTLSDCDCVLYPTDSRGVDAKSHITGYTMSAICLRMTMSKYMPTGLTVHFAEISEVRPMRCWTAWERII